jgi:hypothetical protein
LLEFCHRTTQFPVSQAEFARVFSLFRGLTEAYKWHLSDRIVESLLAIKIQSGQFQEPETMQAIGAGLRPKQQPQEKAVRDASFHIRQRFDSHFRFDSLSILSVPA